jgi:hypothetical protein
MSERYVYPRSPLKLSPYRQLWMLTLSCLKGITQSIYSYANAGFDTSYVGEYS